MCLSFTSCLSPVSGCTGCMRGYSLLVNNGKRCQQTFVALIVSGNFGFFEKACFMSKAYKWDIGKTVRCFINCIRGSTASPITPRAPVTGGSSSA